MRLSESGRYELDSGQELAQSSDKLLTSAILPRNRSIVIQGPSLGDKRARSIGSTDVI